MAIQKNVIILFFTVILAISYVSGRKKVTYFATEHPNITYYDPNYVKYVNVTSRRYGRHDPFYYVSIHIETLVALDETIKAHYYFYELLTNVYKRGFIEMHMSWCDLIKKNDFFGTAVRKYINSTMCPLPPGVYHLYNMTIPVEQVPRGFPFTMGRIYLNVTNNNSQILLSGYINLELKQFTLSK